jgi:hypothetical protein
MEAVLCISYGTENHYSLSLIAGAVYSIYIVADDTHTAQKINNRSL